MFWVAYRQVLGWLTVLGAVIGLLLMVAEPMVLPPDDGEDSLSVRVALAYAGAAVGAVTGLVAGSGVLALLGPWTWYAERTVASRAWVAALGAAGGAALVWVGIGLRTNGAFVSWAIWLPLCGAFALVAAIAAALLTARASRREDDKQHRLQQQEPSQGLL
ncbi:hypothetical protein RS86_03761 [Microbacterium azadirachtae]|uniref:Uncharacterized protein n=1 Tax=Microbacterium azadirachtae TaxID=582680 RepID=A0A0F0LC88_9MICO|nr:hypothetical protein RS86_03761 [Microbacterium azadirachtae]